MAQMVIYKSDLVLVTYCGISSGCHVVYINISHVVVAKWSEVLIPVPWPLMV